MRPGPPRVSKRRQGSWANLNHGSAAFDWPERRLHSLPDFLGAALASGAVLVSGAGSPPGAGFASELPFPSEVTGPFPSALPSVAPDSGPFFSVYWTISEILRFDGSRGSSLWRSL